MAKAHKGSKRAKENSSSSSSHKTAPNPPNLKEKSTKITGYRLLVAAVTVVLGCGKAFLFYHAGALTSVGPLELLTVIVASTLLFWVSTWNSSASKNAWLFHKDYTPQIDSVFRQYMSVMKMSYPAIVLFVVTYPVVLCPLGRMNSLLPISLGSLALGSLEGGILAAIGVYLQYSTSLGRLVSDRYDHSGRVRFFLNSLAVVLGMGTLAFFVSSTGSSLYYRYITHSCKALGYD